ncbi:hypothetical protein [Albimonas pacifica]|uniref:Mono-oxygenase ydhR n=1 Tax=Albimonas pacifica TaxID=1114924 RepID=A0A1I3BI37_9RHOB|nr:hypothetical protein [Albimonas pacifica]SFH61938.1 hypothetical protein SAMN05216258_101106 [Albimonas pacifica]
MIIALVQIPRSPKPPAEAAIKGGLASAPIYREVKGLISKHYLNGEAGGGGVYMFDTAENAQAWFNDEWPAWMESRFGTRPTLTIYDCHVVVDNVAGEVRVDGEPAELPA